MGRKFDNNKKQKSIENGFDYKQIVKPLSEWFLNHKRVLPWRENPTPYYVWVSEIMLQQTRVEAVKPYFERFITELPDVESLANCKEDRLLKLWEGLGYYNRVRNLNFAARQIMEEYGGVIPSDYNELLKLKGIGSYTAGAISSIAYGKSVPAVDGNVLRVISRVSADDSDIMKQSVRKRMEARLLEVMCDEALQVNPSVFNQALMELGAMVCVPNGAPKCEECPWNAFCEARIQNRIAQLPVKSKAKERRIENRTVLVIRDGEKVAIHKRPKKGLLAGLYEIPNIDGHLNTEEVLHFVKELGYHPIRIQNLDPAKHIFSHIEWNMIGYVIFVEGKEFLENDEDKMVDYLFVEADDAKERYAIPSAFAKYAKYMNIPIGMDKNKDV
ncbi:MAG: A/G-specific adenine glycosylase [Agathobacter sp.]|nr:A/G-specific adenine glycosylase [Agathobacter sp.]